MRELELAASAPIVTEDSDAGGEIDQESVAKNLMPPLQFGHCSTTRMASQANQIGDCERRDDRREHQEVSPNRPNTHIAQLKPPLAC